MYLKKETKPYNTSWDFVTTKSIINVLLVAGYPILFCSITSSAYL